MTSYSLDNSTDRILYCRQAGAVTRCHTTKFVGSYDVAQHCFNMMSMLRILHPAPSIVLVWAIHDHDLPERLTGDIPAPAKWAGMLTENQDRIEREILKGVGLRECSLSPEDKKWLRGLDIFELYLFAREQEAMGVPQFATMRKVCVRVMSERYARKEIPPEIIKSLLSFQERSDLSIPEWGV